MEEHPFFAQKAIMEGKELSPLMQGIQDLKYSPEENTPEELAKSYKEDGNFNFKCKKYKFAVASYTEGLKVIKIAKKNYRPKFGFPTCQNILHSLYYSEMLQVLHGTMVKRTFFHFIFCFSRR